jgi:hypothetical protein
MSMPKDSPELIKFMASFSKLRGRINDNPTDLGKRAELDDSLKRLCDQVTLAALTLTQDERSHRRLFAAPVDPKFISAWRAYEQRYSSQLAGLFLSGLGLALEDTPMSEHDRIQTNWDNADYEAGEISNAIQTALNFANEQATEGWRDLPNDFSENIRDGVSAWKRLANETGFDLRGILRRRDLIPFVLIPRHVSNQYGEGERLSLLTHLQQAHDAFVFGAPFASIALMRAILETILKRHFNSTGRDLKELIDNCPSLPRIASAKTLHRLRNLANDILHFNDEQARIPANLESEILLYLYALRSLIELPRTDKS